MQLHFDYYSGNRERTIVMLHGLFGSAKNFTSIAESLTDLAEVYAYDARNHGVSVHTATHTLTDLTQDLADFLAEHEIINPILFGHSMGGLTAMSFSIKHKPRALVIIDIAPRSYAPAHAQEIAAQKLDVSQCANRRDIDTLMASVLPNATVRQFIAMNVARVQGGTAATSERYYWQNNIQAIENSPERTEFSVFVPPIFLGPTLAVRGLASDYVSDADVTLMRSAFPALEIHGFAKATHWLHYTHREQLLAVVRPFLAKLK